MNYTRLIFWIWNVFELKMKTHGGITVFHSRVLQNKGSLTKILNYAIQRYSKVGDSTYYPSYNTYQQIYADSPTFKCYCGCVFDGWSWVFSIVVFVIVFLNERA